MQYTNALTTQSFTCKSPGEIIRSLREKKGFSQREFADRIGMSPSGLSRIEKGRNMQPRKIVAISEALGINPKEIDFLSMGSAPSPIDNLKTIKKMFPSSWKSIIKEGLKEII